MPFISFGLKQKLHPMISRSGRYNYFEDDLLQAIRIPYGMGRLGMYILLPKEAGAFSQFRRDLNADGWQELISQLTSREGYIALPRFKLDFDVNLNEILKTLGMVEAFSKDADFFSMSREQLLISKVLHKTFIEVNEEGTEAAASTAVIMIRSFSAGIPKFSMIVDHSFFFAIRDDETGVIIFMGIVQDPN